jgi:hypothetical protein
MAIAPRWALIALCALAGCTAMQPRQPARAPSRAASPLSDWRSLVVAPFGSQLQDVPVPVHEVLMFGERAGQECYAPDAAARPFAGREVDSYLLCFAHGRLDRVELSARLPEADAEAEFSRYCDQWLTGAATVSPRAARSCGGTAAQGLSFSASLGESPDDAGDGPAVLLSIVVSTDLQR